ncbi:MAG: hypothetical protein ACI4JM_10680 [Oscillospiraceae bacterium]
MKGKIFEITENGGDAVDITIKYSFYFMKTQIFIEGNKRALFFFANHYQNAHGQGFIVIPEKAVLDCMKLLVKYYDDIYAISEFMKKSVGEFLIVLLRKSAS